VPCPMDLQQRLVRFRLLIILVLTDGYCWGYLLQNSDGIAGRGTEKKANLAKMHPARRSMVGTRLTYLLDNQSLYILDALY
jgi:hypothetical protein